MNLLYVLLVLSVFCPVYTYVLYPMILMLRKRKEYTQEYTLMDYALRCGLGYKGEDVQPMVSVLIVGDNAEEKVKNIQQCAYSNFEIITGDYSCISKARGEIVLFTDTKTQLDLMAIHNIVRPFADERIALVVGQQTNQEGNSVLWKYENLVKRLESRIGCVSGTTKAIFAVRRVDIPEVDRKILNKPFYIATKITENGKDVVFQDRAKAYEEKSEGTNFMKHVHDAAGYWQALKLFPKMLFFHHGSFVYVSHRVIKWFVWLNMMTMLVATGALAFSSLIMAALFSIQVVGYVAVMVFGRKEMGGTASKLIGVGYYFIMLNLAYFVGLFWKNRGEKSA